MKGNAKSLSTTTSNTPLLPVDDSQTQIPSNSPCMGTFRNKFVEAPKFGDSTSLGFPPLAKCRVSIAAASHNSISNEGLITLLPTLSS